MHGLALPVSDDLDDMKKVINNHLRNMHTGENAVSPVVRDEVCEEMATYMASIDWPARQAYLAGTWDSPVPALELLPCSTAWACMGCGKTGANHRRMVTHLGEHGDTGHKLVQITVQTIGSYHQQNHELFRLVAVCDPVPDQVSEVPEVPSLSADGLDALDRVRDLLSDVEGDLVITHPGARHLSGFHRSIDWADTMEAAGISVLANLGRRDVLPSDPVWMDKVYKASLVVFERMYRSLSKYKYHPFRVELQR
jgi:hypothetical protein